MSWDVGLSWTGVSGACPAAVPLLRPLIGEAPCTWDIGAAAGQSLQRVSACQQDIGLYPHSKFPGWQAELVHTPAGPYPDHQAAPWNAMTATSKFMNARPGQVELLTCCRMCEVDRWASICRVAAICISSKRAAAYRCPSTQ